MAASRFVLQVVDLKTKEIAASFPPGLDEESDLVTDLVRRVKAKGIGIGRTEDHGLASVRAAMEELLMTCKSRVLEPKR